MVFYDKKIINQKTINLLNFGILKKYKEELVRPKK